MNQQSPMFDQGEDSPLLSKTCQRVKVNPFQPKTRPKQAKMHDCPACLDTGEVAIKNQLIDNTAGEALVFEREIRIGIASGKMPDDLADIFKFKIVDVGNEKRAIVDWV